MILRLVNLEYEGCNSSIPLPNMSIIFFIVLVIVLVLFYMMIFKKRKWKTATVKLSKGQIEILEQHVNFYNRLNDEKKILFQNDVQEFLLNYKITPISTTVTEVEKILIAASAVIPIFAFPDWKYHNLTEILVYPDTFNVDFDIAHEDRNVLGMVGTGAMSQQMILSKRAIVNGFASDKDGHNTAIHEFVHLIDGIDGDIDGLPTVLLEQPYIVPWLELIRKEIDKIKDDDSELRPYGGTNSSEFFAVASEFFFERPELLEEQHPQLYFLLNEIFKERK